MTRSQRIIAAVLLGLAGGSWFIYQMFGPNPPLVVAEDTTWLTEPLADDGLPDYAKWLLDRQREGVTPENNAAIPILEAMWPAGIPKEHHQLVCDEIGMDVPRQPGMTGPANDEELIRELELYILARHNIFPPTQIKTQEAFDKWRAEYEAAIPDIDDEGLEDEVDVWATEPFEMAEYEVDRLLDQCERYPWNRDDIPPLADWIDRHARQFELLHAAAKREEYYCPSTTLLTDPKESLAAVLLNDVSAVRDSSVALATRSMMRQGAGDHKGAVEDITAIYQLSYHLPEDYLITNLVKAGIAKLANLAAHSILSDLETPKGVLLELREVCSAQVRQRRLAESLQGGERLVLLTSILPISGHRDNDASFPYHDNEKIQLVLDIVASSRVDWNFVLGEINSWFDDFKDAMEIDDCRERDLALQRLELDIDARSRAFGRDGTVGLWAMVDRSHRNQLVADMLITLAMPAVRSASRAEDRHNDDIELMQVACALAIYRADNGNYPDSLDALRQQSVRLPADPYTGGQLTYKRMVQGYLLYNRGHNLRDDNGSHSSYSINQGYDVSGDETQVRKALGLPEMEPDEEYLEDQIPAGADDPAIRMPSPPADWSMLRK